MIKEFFEFMERDEEAKKAAETYAVFYWLCSGFVFVAVVLIILFTFIK
jgi:hypothetical protein